MNSSFPKEGVSGSKMDLERIFPGDSEMARLMRTFDWAASPLGPVETWPQNLRVAVGICLTSRFPIVMWWGDALMTLYNDAYIPFLGKVKHPAMFCYPAQEVWAEIWPTIGPLFEGVRRTRKASWSENLLVFFDRNLPKEEVYVTFSYAPVLGENNAVEGIFCACTETTAQIIGKRQLETLRKLGIQAAEAQSVAETCRQAVAVLRENPYDIPIAAVYLADETEERVSLAATTGLSEDRWPPSVSFKEEKHSPGSLGDILWSKQGTEIDDLSAIGFAFDEYCWPGAACQALVLPIRTATQDKLAGFLVTGVNPRRPLDAEYRTFFDLVAGHIATNIANARAYEEEKRRAEALAELDRAKTTFFSNVSHEFRTPLTLMLGPMDEILENGGGELPPDIREHLSLIQKNTMRLLKLVNTLLDFSRIEAGRAEAVYEPTDLAAYTQDLASVFRSAIEKEGLRLVIECPPLPAPVYLDREMWEKVILNLLSNAFKFTFQGGISVSLHWLGDKIELTISDTGTGISEEEIPYIFKRFHRIRGAKSRTYEGTGIGLALVQELVNLHGGKISVQSVYGEGTTFTILIPTGYHHLPQDRIGAARTLPSTAVGSLPFVNEALSWASSIQETVGDVEQSNTLSEPLPNDPIEEKAIILLADDNADMRDYILHLLSPNYHVKAVGDGLSAFAAIKECLPDLVLADVMMPGLDGFELLNKLRQIPETQTIPVIMLSARAGEESKLEGLAKGADDYLIKPFRSRELLAKISAQLKMSRIRREALRQQQDELAATRRLYELSTRQVRPDNLGEILNAILGTAIALSGADMGSLQLFEEESGALKIKAHRGFEQPFLDFFASVYPETDGCGSVGGVAFAQRHRIIVEDVKQSPIFAGTPALNVMLVAGVRAVQSTPLISRDGLLVGMLSTHYRNVLHGDDFNLHFIDLLAGQAADIIVQVRTQQALREQGEELLQHRDNLAQLVEKQMLQLRRSERHYQTLVNNAPLEFAIFDAKFRYVYRTPRPKESFGQTNDLVVGKTWGEIGIPEADWRPWQEKFDEVLTTGRKVVYETRQSNDDGELRDMLVHVVPEIDEIGHVESFLMFALDITERKKMEAELMRLDRLNTVGEMAAAIGHEVRNPMTTVRGYLQMFQSKAESAQYREQFTTMIEELDRANGIITDFLSLAKNRAIELKLCNLNDIISTLVPLLQAEALRTGHELKIDIGDIPDVSMNEKEIRQLLLNFVRNSFEAMEPGGEMTIETWAENETVVLEVRDSGTGIPQEVMDKLGTPFITTKENGTGLGLAVCYRIAERHGAKIDVDTSPQGTTFFVRFKVLR